MEMIKRKKAAVTSLCRQGSFTACIIYPEESLLNPISLISGQRQQATEAW